MNVLITGSAGMLGSAVYPAFVEAGYTVFATDLFPRQVDGLPMGWLDVRDQEVVDEVVGGHDLVLHLAAETDLEVCEQNVSHAYRTNTIGTQYVSSACQRHGIDLVYIGTAGIFDGTKPIRRGPYTEDDQPRPINVYGMTKYLGEIVAAQNKRTYIVRAGWMVGGDQIDHKFVGKIRDQLESGAKTIYAVTDKVGTPTYTKDFAANLLRLVQTRKYGTYHMVCHGEGTRYDVAKEICAILGYDVDVVPVTSERFEAEYFAPRPKSESLTNRRLAKIGNDHMRDWREALRDYLTT